MPAEHPKFDWYRLIETALTAEGNVGSTYNRFYEYSFTNQIYLRMQGVREPVATYERWKRLGRQVIRGAKAKDVIRPVIIKRETDEGEIEKALVGFKLVRCIFSVSDTTGKELPPVVLPHWDVKRALAALKIQRLPFDEPNGNVQGYSRGREVAINPVAVNPAKTLMHELGHVVLGHTIATTFGEYATHRGVMEFQAEATAYLTMNELEQLDEESASASRGYIQHWLRSERPGEREIRLVFAATDQILRAGRVAVAEVALNFAPNFGGDPPIC